MVKDLVWVCLKQLFLGDLVQSRGPMNYMNSAFCQFRNFKTPSLDSLSLFKEEPLTLC